MALKQSHVFNFCLSNVMSFPFQISGSFNGSICNISFSHLGWGGEEMRGRICHKSLNTKERAWPVVLIFPKCVSREEYSPRNSWDQRSDSQLKGTDKLWVQVTYAFLQTCCNMIIYNCTLTSG